MKSRVLRWILFSAGAICLPALFLAAQRSDSGYIVRTVKRGETVSLLCIEIYGHYTPKMGKAFASANPKVKNIDLIYVGQRLRFPDPKTGQASGGSSFSVEKNPVQGVVTYMEGSAKVKSSGTGTASDLTVNSLVQPGDTIETTGKGRVELLINKESVVRVRENSRVAVKEYRDTKKEKGSTKVDFSLGTVWTRVKKFKDSVMRFQLELPTAMAGVHGTVYQASVENDSSSEVSVYEGEVRVAGTASNPPKPTAGLSESGGPHEVAGPHEVSMEEWTRVIRDMQKIYIDQKGNASEPSSFSRESDDEWVKWNEWRDRRIARMFGEI